MHAIKQNREVDPGIYPPIEDYALLGDCESTALVSRTGSIDWCCMPRMDADSCFGRLLDWSRGGYCSMSPADLSGTGSKRAYEDGTMVLVTRFENAGGSVLLRDFFALSGDPGRHDAADHLCRIANCTAGTMVMLVAILPRFDFGAILPDLRKVGPCLYTACGSNQGLLIDCNIPLELRGEEAMLRAEVTLRAGETIQLSIRFVAPEALEQAARHWTADCRDLPAKLECTLSWWASWEYGARRAPHPDPLTRRSALVLKALCFERTGAIAAAATTSLPESPGGERNWDYRFSWIRDSVLTVRALHGLGFMREADRFRAFIERSAAGNARQLQLMYGLDGRRRLTEVTLAHLEGWRGARPVRIGNAAAGQTQLDIYGGLLELAWLWHDPAHPMDDAYWDFLIHAVDVACERWRDPDHGIWEIRDAPRHFVHSKAMCWVAVDRGIRLAKRHGRRAPTCRWHAMRQTMRAEIDREGYDHGLGVYRQAYGETHADAALLLLPQFGYLPFGDPRMLRTAEWIARELDRHGLLLRYARPDGLAQPEGTFLACTFWLAECLARQGRRVDAQRAYDRAAGCANELGLFSEEFASDGNGMLGNFPQALTHLAQVTARLALDSIP